MYIKYYPPSPQFVSRTFPPKKKSPTMGTPRVLLSLPKMSGTLAEPGAEQGSLCSLAAEAVIHNDLTASGLLGHGNGLLRLGGRADEPSWALGRFEPCVLSALNFVEKETAQLRFVEVPLDGGFLQEKKLG